MTRSTAGRHRNVRLGAAAAGLAILAAGALAGCSAGQISETATIVSAVPGGSASVPVPTEQNPNGALLIKNVTVDYNGIDGYAAGSTATLSVWMVNQATVPVTVTAGDAQLIDPTKASQLTPLGAMSLTPGVADVAQAQSVPSLAPGPSSSAPESSAPAAGASAPPSGSGGPGGSASAAPTPTPAAPPSVTIQPGTLEILSVSAGTDTRHLVIAGLKDAVVPGDTVQLTFNVTSGGKPLQSTQVVAPVAPPASPAPRVSDTGFPPSLPPS